MTRTTPVVHIIERSGAYWLVVDESEYPLPAHTVKKYLDWYAVDPNGVAVQLKFHQCGSLERAFAKKNEVLVEAQNKYVHVYPDQKSWPMLRTIGAMALGLSIAMVALALLSGL